jgi:ABC-type lipoprotein release transport system permease subunit
MIVRKLSPTGWAPIPAAEAVRIAREVPGVLRAEARVWGLAAGPAGPATVMGVGPEGAAGIDAPVKNWPAAGEAILGPGIGVDQGADTLVLTGEHTLELNILDRLPPETGIALNDVVLVSITDAAVLLGLAPGYASDLAVDVFHSQEAEALAPDLAAAFPWPVRITTRSETAGIYAVGASRRSGIIAVGIIPAVLSVCLLTATIVRDRIGRRHEVGLLKALGWTTADIVHFQVFRSAFIGIPATVAGLSAALFLVFRPATTWPGYLFFGWEASPPPLYLEMSGALWPVLAVAGLVLLPFLTATLAAALKTAVVEPLEILEREN